MDKQVTHSELVQAVERLSEMSRMELELRVYEVKFERALARIAVLEGEQDESSGSAHDSG